LTASRDTNDDPCAMSTTVLAGHFASGALSPVEVATAALERAEAINSELNAFVELDANGALAAARDAEDRWRRGAPLSPIDGMPTTIKDIVLCRGLDVRYGSETAPDVSSQPDSPSVRKLRSAGAVIIGLTASPEFGWKAVTDSRKNGVTRNPWNAAKTSGGSSGGAAVAAATGAGVLHLGTDGGGSIRIPAAFTGIVGHKPSFGRVGASPPSAFGTVAHIGPMARTVGDVVSMLNAMSGRDSRDWTQPPFDFEPVPATPVDLSNKLIGYWKTPCVGDVDPEISGAVESVLRELETAGARVVEIRLPYQDEIFEVFLRYWYVGAASRLLAVDEKDRDRVDPGFLRVAAIGERYTAVERVQAEVQRARFGSQMNALLEDYDLVVSPTVAIPAFDAGHEVPPGSGLECWIEWASFSFPINLSQQPACSLPCGLTTSGLPIGIQIIGARGDDAHVLGAALTYEQMFPNRFPTIGDRQWVKENGKAP